jgi:hypothetical protein
MSSSLATPSALQPTEPSPGRSTACLRRALAPPRSSAMSPWHRRRLPSSTTVSHSLASVARASPSAGLWSFTSGVVSSRGIVIQRVHEVLVWPQAPMGGTHLLGTFFIPARLQRAMGRPSADPADPLASALLFFFEYLSSNFEYVG